MVIAIFRGVFCFCLFFAVHLFWFRFFSPKEKARTLIRQGAVTAVLFAAWLLALSFTSVENALSFSTYAFLFLGYLEFYFTVDRSITTRMLMFIESAGPNGLTYDEMAKLYPPDFLLKRRFTDLEYGNYIVRRDGSFINTKKGKRTAH